MIDMKWEQPMLHGSGYVHVDAAYWGRNWGILLAIDDLTGQSHTHSVILDAIRAGK